jgi:hypothetical protein
MKTCGGWWRCYPLSSTSALDGGEWPASRPGRLTLEEIAFGTDYVGDKVGPRSGLDPVEKRKLLSLPEIEPWPSNL